MSPLPKLVVVDSNPIDRFKPSLLDPTALLMFTVIVAATLESSAAHSLLSIVAAHTLADSLPSRLHPFHCIPSHPWQVAEQPSFSALDQSATYGENH